MLRYRDIFYKQYYSSQLGRDAHNDQRKLEEEAAQLKPEIMPLLPAGKDSVIVDLGCGIGSLVYLCKQSGYAQSSGVDVSEEMVKVAHSLGLSQVSQDDVGAFLDRHRNHFDVITGIDIIEHFTKDELVDLMIKVKEALKPGGIAIFRTPNMDAQYASIYAHGDFTHECFLNASSAQQLMMNCGFKEVAVMPSLIRIQNPIKEMIRKMIWYGVLLRIKIELFASGRSSSKNVFTPNLVIKVKR